MDEEEDRPAEPMPGTPDSGDGEGPKPKQGETADRETAPDEQEQPSGGGGASVFPVVAVGASAGGLKVFHELLASLPPDPGFALVFLQHLDPDHESLMADLLNRKSQLPVSEAADGTKLEPNHAYVIPPNKFLRIADGGLFLDDPVKRRGMRMPIDYFFRSLAEQRQEQAICIVLSGTGSDGTQGLRDITEVGGLSIVQDPATAEYDGMPRSAVATGLADMVLPVEEMPRAISDYLKHPYLRRRDRRREPGFSVVEPGTFKSIISLLLAHTDFDFSHYKSGTIERRIHRRMGLRHVSDPQEYLKLLRSNADELQALFKDLLIGVTRFFRDPQVWEDLSETILTPIVRKRDGDEPIRVWVPGCSSGEEAYTIAILLFELFEREHKPFSLQLYATDLDEDAIEIARAGRYPESIAADVSTERLDRYFEVGKGTYRVAKRIRESIVFANQNLISDPPFSRLDLVSCRNVMIYLETAVQQKILQSFHFALREGGVLLLGTSESADKSNGLFSSVHGVERAFRRSEGGGGPTRFAMPSTARPRQQGLGRRQSPLDDFQEIAAVERSKSLLLDAFAPASVLCDRRFMIRYMHGLLRNYLDFPTGEPNNDLTVLALEGLRPRLRSALNKALQASQTVEEIAHRVPRGDGKFSVRIRVEPVMSRPHGESMLLVSFIDEEEARPLPAPEEIADAGEDGRRADQLEYELQTMREDYQSAIEELETSNEELKASNEEVMSMNEELQSSNEELETSREELQSLNEELSTLNTQLQEKLQELEATNDDLNNLLTSTDIATLFLDAKFLIRRFTPAARGLLNIIDSDIGRPITDLAPRVSDSELVPDARQTLDDLQPREKELDSVEGKHYLRRVRPYRTSDNRIAGIVVTYSDVTRLNEAVERVSRRERQQAAVAELGPLSLTAERTEEVFERAIALLRERLACSHAKILAFDKSRGDFLLVAGEGFAEAEPGVTRVPGRLDSQAGYTLSSGAPIIVRDLPSESRFSGPALLLNAGIVSGISVAIGDAADPWGVLGVHSCDPNEFTDDDVTFVRSIANVLAARLSRERLEAESRQLADRLDTVLEAADVGSWVWDPDSDSSIWDVRLYEMLGISKEEPARGHLFFDGIHPDERPAVDEAIRRAIDEGADFRSEFRFGRPDGRWVWLAGLGRMVTAADGSRRLFGVNIDIDDKKLGEVRLAESEQRRRLAVEAAGLGTWEWTVGSDWVECDARTREICGFENSRVGVDEFVERIHPDDAKSRQENIDRAIESDATFSNQFRYSLRGEERWLQSQGRIIRGTTGEPRVVAIMQDITERRREEEHQFLLMAELDHRVKNILANVNAIARHTASSRPEPADFLPALEGRLMAMADAHSLLSVAQWRGVELNALLSAEISPYLSDRLELDRRISIDGDRFTLSPQAAQSFCLFLHELVTNAAKHGALRDDSGQIEISWRETDDGIFEFNWQETNAEDISPPNRQGFGLSVIEDMTTSDLGATVELDFRQRGLVCRLTAPCSDMKATGRAEDVPGLLRMEQEPQVVGTKHQAHSMLKVLLVEDVWTIAMHMQSLLEGAGHSVVGPATSVEDALALADMPDIDVAILDIRLGSDLVFPVARFLADRSIPFAFATGYADTNIVPEDFAAAEVISKPFTAGMLSGLLGRLTQR